MRYYPSDEEQMIGELESIKKDFEHAIRLLQDRYEWPIEIITEHTRTLSIADEGLELVEKMIAELSRNGVTVT